MRIVLMGTPDLARTVFDEFFEVCNDRGFEIIGVYTQPPRKAGRGKKTVPSPVHAWANTHDLPVFTPASLKNEAAQGEFAALNPDLALVAAYGQILPLAILEAPTNGCLNVHGSLLPRWRGAAPIQRAIMAGDRETGVMIMRMEAGLDTGPVYTSRTIAIADDMTAGELHDQLASGNSSIIAAAIDMVLAGAEPTPQPDEGVTYAHKIDKAEAQIDWTRPAAEVDQMIRGLSPFPGAWFALGDERIKVLRSAPGVGTGQPGEALDGALTIACGDGTVQLLELQRAGKKPMSAADLLRGMDIPQGTSL